MVMTCEPGLYVAAEGIGIRLENDILITQGAPEDLVGERLLCPRRLSALCRRNKRSCRQPGWVWRQLCICLCYSVSDGVSGAGAACCGADAFSLPR